MGKFKFFILSFLCSALSYGQEEKLVYPYAYKSNVTDNYFGTTVADPYRWLENDTLTATRTWIAEENKLAESYINKQTVRYPVQKYLEMNRYVDYGVTERSGKYYFEFRRADVSALTGLYMKTKIDQEHVGELVISLADYGEVKGENISLRDFAVSQDNKQLAFALSRNGSDWMEIRVKNISPSGKMEDVITGVKFSRIKWKGKGFFYCSYKSLEKDKPLTSLLINPCLYYHSLGTKQEEDSLIFEYPGTRISEVIDFDVLEEERFLIVYHIAHESGSGKKMYQISYIDFQNKEQRALKKLLSHPYKAEIFINVVSFMNGTFMLHTNLNADHCHIVVFDPRIPGQVKLLIGEKEEVLTQVHLIDGKIVCLYMKDIEQMCVTYNSSGKMLRQLKYPSGSSVEGFEGSNKDSTTLFYFHSFLHPPVAYEFNLRTLETKLLQTTRITYNPDEYEMKKVFYESKDGQKIPMIIAGKKGMKRNSNTPVILYGYGGYGISITPFFDIGFIMHIRNGGLVALPCIRGGGEYGEEWHRKGMLEHKQNVFDDFIAAAEYLIANGYTNSARLALMGGSNGGLLVGAVLTQRPDLFKVAVCEVGIYDMLRYQYYTVGFASAKEFGVSTDSAQFSYLYNYSPLHAVKKGISYPATLIVTGDHDDRAVPMHSYKFAAALQENSSGKNPILVYTQYNTGHQGGGKTDTYIYTFIYKNIGLKMREISPVYLDPRDYHDHYE